MKGAFIQASLSGEKKSNLVPGHKQTGLYTRRQSTALKSTLKSLLAKRTVTLISENKVDSVVKNSLSLSFALLAK